MFCSKCSGRKFWEINPNRLKCQNCYCYFTPSKGAIKIDKKLLRRLISELILEHSTNTILARVKVSKYKLLKILTLLRTRMTKDVPDVFSGIVEVDETYLGGRMKNQKLKERLQIRRKYGDTRGLGILKQPVFGILCRQGKVYAEIVPDTEAKDPQPLIEKQVKHGSIICSDTWRAYTGLAAKGYVHRLVEHGKNEYSDKKGGHINGLEGFWGYLKRKLAAKGGIRRKKLPLYLGEYIWRYNHRNLSFKEQEKRLFTMFFQNFKCK